MSKRSRPEAGLAQPLLLLLMAAAAGFIVIAGAHLPAWVASHFDAAGRPNGFMSKQAYITVMLAIVIVTPLMIGWLPALTLRQPNTRINLPNRDYWLAPERRAATIEILLGRMRLFACLLLAFLCYAHALVVRANQSAPPRLSSSALELGVVVFLVAALGWVLNLMRRFRRTD